MEQSRRLFGPGAFYKSTLAIAVPIMLQQLIQSLVSLVDNFMVAGLGDVSMSGVNVAGQILFVFMVFLNTVCMTGGIFMTQFFGAGDGEGMGQAFRFKLVMGLAAFVPYFLVTIVFPRAVMSLMLIGNTQADLILNEAVKYMHIMFLMGIPYTISVCIATSLRDMGQVKIPLYVTMAAMMINAVLNWVLIYGHFGLPRMGVRGAAYATVIARAFEFILFIVVYSRLKPAFMIRMADFFRINGKLFRETLKKGALILFCEMVWVFSETITTAVYNGRGGADVVSGMAAGFSIANLLFATEVILGKSLGAGKLEKARTEKTWLLSGAAVFGLFVMLFGFGTTLIVPVVYGRLSASAVKICRDMVTLIAILMPFWLYMNTQQAIARAGGDTAMGFYVDGLLTLFVMIPMVLLLGKYTLIGPVMMYACVKVIDLMKVVIFHFWLKRERWLKNLTKVA